MSHTSPWQTGVKVLALLLPVVPSHVCTANEITSPSATPLSPYFFVHSDDPAVDRLPLQSTQVHVAITGVIADVTVVQHYRNDGSRPIDADYIFPASVHAAVHALSMTVGDRHITAEIREKQQARKEFAAAKAEGKSATLLEQQRPNVFQTRIANILPGDDLEVRLQYTELLIPTAATYEFVYPTVVGPRYASDASTAQDPRENWQANPYLHDGEQAQAGFDLSMTLESGIPIKQLVSTSHVLDVHYSGTQHADVKLQNSNAANRDFILRYQLAGNTIETGLLLYEGERENYFLAMVEPPTQIKPEQIPARDYVFVVDVSGSMSGFPLDTTKALMKDLVGNLRPIDTFNVLLFSGGSHLLAPRSLPATTDNLKRAITVIDAQNGGGGTELLPALNRALALPASNNVSRSIVVVTDGFVDVETETFDLIRNSLGRANVFAFGIGTSVNRFLIDGMARAGMGEAFVVTHPDAAQREAARLREYIAAPTLTHVQAVFKDLDVYDVAPQNLPDLMASRPVVVYGKWRGPKTGQLTISGQQAGQSVYTRTLRVADAVSGATLSALGQLWARNRITMLGDYNRLLPDDSRIAEITKLGLDHHLLTAYTSFVAVDRVIRNANPTDNKSVTQPLALPAGVSDLAVGEVPTTPEPETYALLALAGLAMWWTQRRKAEHV